MGETDALSAAGRHRAVMLDAAAGLEFAISSPVGRGVAWREHVDGELHRLRDALEEHTREVEGPDGLLGDIVRQAPRLSNAVERMKVEHVDMHEEMSRILHELARLPDDDIEKATDEIRESVLALLGKLSRHRQRGADLVYRAYDVDIGGLG
jgi:seryl-tRNA synthetase